MKNTINSNLQESLNKLKVNVPLAYVSKFDFASPEITQGEKDSLIRNESIFVKKFKECSASQFEMCKALAEIQAILKKAGIFVEWYKYMGIPKDRVYELLNRYKLYKEFTGDKEQIEWVTSLSELAITHLSRKDIEQEWLYEVFDRGLKKASDIEMFLEEKRKISSIENSNSIPFENLITSNSESDIVVGNIKENNIIKDEIQEAVIVVKKDVTDDIGILKKEFKNNLDKVRNYSSAINSISKICETKNFIKESRKQLEKIEKDLKEQEEKLINENNLRMFSDKER